ncbi:Ima1 N-terminal domain-containing protein [Neohortaea acidophila]|uniref:Ima1 N-terminal domain-containing protein n=1 Tax=Neohortaea acidophila TaxID=245834 RepID=A0A6A6PJV5_9PEZI|nr:Ima1 N-terminal domain-containing protein [Neohortaea acidophila]KAF2480215.1 Ima1 N-terminal domain-containing protein [Neohortaea acidophila]
MFGRLRCHFCGQRSDFSKGTTEFQCTKCEALNFFDEKGEVAEAPSHITNPPAQQYEQTTTARSPTPFALTSSHEQQSNQQQPFCQRCLNNQRMYVDALNSYLPDDDHPRFQEYLDKLPQKKAELEKKYPQVCKACAPKVQERIHQADYQGMSWQAAAAMNETRARRGRGAVGRRDDWWKWFMRILLPLVGVMVYASLAVQVAWHLYGIFDLIFTAPSTDGLDGMDLMFEPTHKDCLKHGLAHQFDPACHQLFAGTVKKALLVSLCLIWYNPGLKDWYHHTHRIEAVRGQTEHFRTQFILLIARVAAWWNLSDQNVVGGTRTSQRLAGHGLIIGLIILAQWMSELPIKSEKWRIKGKIMPRPDEKDVFGAMAGPADELYPRQASSTNPRKLFGGDQKPFPIANLAPVTRNTRGYSRLDLPGMPPPSPPGTESASDNEGDAMDIDTPPPISRTAGMPGAAIDRTFRPKTTHQPKAQPSSLFSDPNLTQPSSWGAVRHQLYNLQDTLRESDERKKQREEEDQRSRLRFEPPQGQPSPFRGTIPQAPMSVGRRLRNPPSQLSFKQASASKQQNQMKHMREIFESGRVFGSAGTSSQQQGARKYEEETEDEDFSPAKSRTRIDMAPKPASWHLPGDGQATTGLEEALGGRSFAIADEVDVDGGVAPAPATAGDVATGPQVTQRGLWLLFLVTVVPVVLAVAWRVESIRRPVCLWLVGKMEEWGI